jgi:type I restriction enzyme S subunit
MKLLPYTKCKASGVEWLGDVPSHWQIGRLRQTTPFTINGTWGDEPTGTDDLVCIRVADFDRERLKVVASPSTERSVEPADRRKRLLRVDDLLIEKSGGGEKQLVGAVVRFQHRFEAVCSNFIARMPVRAGYSSRYWTYLHAAIYAGRLNYPAIRQTTGIQNLDLQEYLSIRCAIPPGHEQAQIANFLDIETARISELVEKKRTLIERLKEQRSALISRTVTRGLPRDAARAAGLDPHPRLKSSGIDWLGRTPQHWMVKPLRRLVTFMGGATPDKGKPEFWDGDIPWISPKDMKRRLIDDGPDHVSAEALAKSPLRMVPSNSVLVVVRGMILAHSFPVAITTAPVTINQDMKALRARAGLEAEFLCWYLEGLARVFVSLADESAHGTRKIETETLGNVEICVPASVEQAAIVKYLNRETTRINSLIAGVATAIDRLQEYRTALITAAVTGKIDVRNTVTTTKAEANELAHQ